jgi:SHS2 domain-containing protein
VTTQSYEFFEHTADIGLNAFGKTQLELFENAARGLYAAMGEFVTSGQAIQHELELSASNAEELLLDFLRELHFLFDTRRWVFSQFEWREGSFKIQDGTLASGDNLKLSVILRGAVADFENSTLKTELKAVTYHHLKVVRTDGVWKATVILDV